MTGVLVGRDAAELNRRAQRLKALMPDIAKLTPGSILEKAAQEWHWWVGTPDHIAAQVQAYIQLGATQIFFQVFDYMDLSAIQLLGQTVLPQLRVSSTAV